MTFAITDVKLYFSNLISQAELCPKVQEEPPAPPAPKKIQSLLGWSVLQVTDHQLDTSKQENLDKTGLKPDKHTPTLIILHMWPFKQNIVLLSDGSLFFQLVDTGG